MKNKLKTYVIMVSQTYPAYHSKKMELTHFIDKIQYGIKYHNSNYHPNFYYGNDKIHTFRGNYTLWEMRIKEVLAGNAVISLRYHTLGRYVKGNKQIEIVQLDKHSGVGVEKFSFSDGEVLSPYVYLSDDENKAVYDEIWKNDGLEKNDFLEWFEKGDYDLNEPMACIQFTSFRYGTAKE